MNGYSDKMMRSTHAASSSVAMTGTVKRWTDSGYRFIRPDSGAGDVFCHIRNVKGSRIELRAGDRVSYELGNNARTGKIEAQNVTLIDD